MTDVSTDSHAGSGPLEVAVLTSLDQFRALAPEWDGLLERASADSICLSWDWLDTWCDVFAPPKIELAVITVRRAGQLVGVAPFWVHRARVLGFRVRSLRFLGTGEPEEDTIVSEYQDIVCAREDAAAVVAAVARALVEEVSWDRALLTDLLTDSLAASALAMALESAGIPVQNEVAGVRYAIELPGSWDAYLARLAPGSAKRIPYKRRKLERAGKLAETVIDKDAELDDAFARLAELHTARWTSRGEPGVFASSRFYQFHRRLAAQLLRRGALNFRLLTLDNRPIAALYNFRWRGIDYYYQGGIEMVALKNHSPGTVAHAYAIDAAIRAGMIRYDLMRGDAGSYKAEFGCGETPMVISRFFSKTPTGIALRSAVALKASLRQRSNLKATGPD